VDRFSIETILKFAAGDRLGLDIRHEPQHCPHCRALLTVATDLGTIQVSRKKKRRNKVTHYSNCDSCGHWMIYEEGMKMRAMTPEEQIEFKRSPEFKKWDKAMKDLRRTRQYVRKVSNAPNN
jgi:hypothetical protein